MKFAHTIFQGRAITMACQDYITESVERKKLGYRTPEELFDEFLDSVYAAEGCGSIAQDGSQRLPS